jgi:hypothetical protein
VTLIEKRGGEAVADYGDVGECGDHGPHLTTSFKSASIGVTVNAN